MSQVELHKHVYPAFASGARSAGVSQVSAEYNVDDFSTISYIVDLTAVSGSPVSYSLATKIQYSPDSSSTSTRWYDLPNTALTVSSVTTNNIVNVPLLTARRVRAVYTLSFTGGTSPQATFSVDVAYGNTPPSSTITNTGTAVSIADGADVAEGSTSDAAYAGSGSASAISLLKGIYAKPSSGADTTATGALGALNAAVTVATAGETSVGVNILAGTLAGTVLAEYSKDGGTTWFSTIFVNVFSGTINTSLVLTNPNAAQAWAIVADGGTTHVRVRVSAYTSGTATAQVSATAGGKQSIAVLGWNGTSMGLIQLDASNFLKTREQYAPGYEDNAANRALVEERLTPTYISTATTTVCKTGSGVLGRIVVQGGTTGTIIIYDNTAGSGTILASFDTTNALANYAFNAVFAIGCTVVTSAATKLTVLTR